MYKIKFKDYTYINIIKKTFMKHFIIYFKIEEEFQHNYYSDLIKDENFLYNVWCLNFYNELFVNLLIDSYEGTYSEYTLQLIEKYHTFNEV